METGAPLRHGGFREGQHRQSPHDLRRVHAPAHHLLDQIDDVALVVVVAVGVRW